MKKLIRLFAIMLVIILSASYGIAENDITINKQENNPLIGTWFVDYVRVYDTSSNALLYSIPFDAFLSFADSAEAELLSSMAVIVEPDQIFLGVGDTAASLYKGPVNENIFPIYDNLNADYYHSIGYDKDVQCIFIVSEYPGMIIKMYCKNRDTVPSNNIIANNTSIDFSLHNGVKFGMSVSEVESLEKKAGFNVEDVEVYGSKKVSCIKSVRGKIAGLEGSLIQYIFDKNNSLYAATYVLGTTNWLGKSLSEMESDYNIIQNALENKYGKPNDAIFTIANGIGFEPIEYISSFGMERTSSSYFPDYESWLVKVDDFNYVVIVHFKEIAENMPIVGTLYFNNIGYQWYSAGEIYKAINNATNEAEENEAQRLNDL